MSEQQNGHVGELNLAALLPQAEPDGAASVVLTAEEITKIEADLEAKLKAQHELADEVAKQVQRLKINELAKTKYAAEQSAGEFARLPGLVTLADALAQPDEGVKWRIHGLLPEGGNATLVAPEKAGKTTLVGNLVRSLVDGTPFLGSFDVEPPAGRVAVLNFEVTGQMLTSWMRDMNIVNNDRVTMLNLRGFRLPLLVPDGVKWLAEQLRAAEVSVMVVDPFGAAFRSAGGANENDNSEVGRFLSALDEVKQLAGVGELLMPVHAKREQNEGAERSRGASVLNDWPDAIWSLVLDGGSQRYIEARGRDVAVPNQLLAFDSDTRTLTTKGGSRAAERRSTEEKAVLDWLAKNPKSSERKVIMGLSGNVPKGQVPVVLARLRGTGAVSWTPGAHGAMLHSLATRENVE